MTKIENSLAEAVIQGLEYLITHKGTAWFDGRGADPKSVVAEVMDAMMYGDIDLIADVANDNQSLFPADISRYIDEVFMRL